MLNKIIAMITVLFSILFFSYRKGKNDQINKGNNEILKDIKKIRKAKARRSNDNINVVTDRLLADADNSK